MPLPISVGEARKRLDQGAHLIDIRSEAEFRREHVPGSLNIPQDRLMTSSLPEGALIFTCRSGGRTGSCLADIESRAGERAVILNGGLMAWKQAGGATRVDRTQPIDIMRQVQIAAGTLVLTGLALSALVNPWFLGLSAFVGAGLMFAGVTGWCGMAQLLARMPWNRAAA